MSTNMMQAVVLKQFGSTDHFSLETIIRPEPIEGQVCIRIKAAAFNPVDYKIRQGWYGGNPPKVIGCDCSGIVEKVGPNEQEFSIGDKVYAMSFVGTGFGSYAEYVCVPKELVAKKPENISFNEAAAVPLAAMTAYRATIANRAFKEGDIVFVAGIGGGVGSFAVQFLNQIKVEIFSIAKDIDSAQFIEKNLGIPQSHILIYEGFSMDELKEKLLKMNKGQFFDATLDLVGGELKKLCLELTGYSGHFSTILPEKDFNFPFWGENDIPRARNISVHQVNIGAEMNSPNPKNREIYVRHLAHISEMIKKGILQVPKVTPLGDLSLKVVEKAHQLLEGGRVKGKLVMTISNS